MIEKATSLLCDAVDSGRIPGGALGVLTADGRVERFHYGRAALRPDRVTLIPDHWFDLASLTKPLATLRTVLRLAERGALDLDDPLERHLPDMAQYEDKAPARKLPLRALLAHRSGLRATAPIYGWADSPERLRTMVLQHSWTIGEPVYSDVNYILLGLVVERVTGKSFAEIPLDDGLTFAPNPELAVATEDCPWRGRVLRGEVHDENAFALGGAAGHAGLFGRLDDVLGQIRRILAGEWLSPAAAAEMLRPHSETRALGWERKHAHWAGGSLCSPETIGHTGFTGVGMWIDMARGYGWTLLTNRVHPSRHAATGIMDLRRAVGNALAAAQG